MKTTSLDILEKSELPLAQARAILSVMESELLMRDSSLATKNDLHELELRMDVKFANLETKVAAQIGQMLRWNFAFWIAQLGAIAGILKLLK